MRTAGLLSSAPLVGRGQEMAALGELVVAHPLVTLTGPGGTGKTRLALAALDELAEQFPDGVTFCPLASVTDPSAVRTSVATRLGLLLSGGDEFSGALDDRHLLVVLDSCEHLLAATREVAAELLDAGPDVRVLCTSRESLGMPGERLLPVGPLAVVEGTVDEVAAGPAVRLFTERAQAVLPEFRVDASNAHALVDLCRRLDGLPLALELAASRARSMTPAEMLTRIAGGAGLEAPAKTASPDRHRSLHNVVDWSYRLLDPKSQQVFERMSVVAGGCLLEAAEVICSGTEVGPEEVFDLLDGLVDRSLLYTAHRSGRTRYLQLQTLRSYAAEQLEVRGEAAHVADKHADFYASVCDEMWQRLHGVLTEQDVLLLSADLNNVGRAVRHCLAHDDDPGRAYRLIAGLWPLVFAPDSPTVAALAADVLSAWPPATSDHPLGPDVAGVAAGASLALDQAHEARRYADLAIAAASPGTVPPMWARRVLGEVLTWYEGEPARGLETLDRALAEAESTYRLSCVLEVEHVRLLALPELGRFDDALDLARAVMGEHEGTFEGCYAQMAEVLLVARADVDAAAALLPALVASSGEDTTGLTRLLLDLTRGTVEMLKGRHVEAASHFAAALELSLRRGVRRFWASQIGSVLPLLAAHRPDVARDLWGAVLAAQRRAIQLETVGLAEAVASLGQVEPRPMSSQHTLELAGAALRGVMGSAEGPEEPVASSDPPSATVLDPLPSDGATGELVHAAGVWTATWSGRRSHLPDLKGMHDLAVLLGRPGSEVHVLDLYGASAGAAGVAPKDEVGGLEGGLGDGSDRAARTAYRERIRQLQEEVEDADALGDAAGSEKAHAELDALVSHLAGAYGLGGRPRQVGDPAEKARSAVAWRLRSALRRIAAADPVLGRHLTLSVHTGTWCRYEPPDPVVWTVRT